MANSFLDNHTSPTLILPIEVFIVVVASCFNTYKYVCVREILC